MLANSIVLYLLKWGWLSFKCFAGWMVLIWLMAFMSRCWHIFVKRLLTSFTLLLKLSFLGTINETLLEFVSFFREFAIKIMEFAIWLAALSDLRSLVPTWRIIYSACFTSSRIQLVFAELNVLTLTRYLCLVLFVR